jgi:glucose/arabinose dehydrogenase
MRRRAHASGCGFFGPRDGLGASKEPPASPAIRSIDMADRALFDTRKGGHAAKLIIGSFWAGCFLIIAELLAANPTAIAQQKPHGKSDSCDAVISGITLLPGFCATIFADNLGHARQMAFGPNGVLHVNTFTGWSGQPPPAGGFLVALKDTKGDGHADLIERFGEGVPQGSAGGTGIRIYNDGLYAEQNDKIIRYPLPTAGIAPKEQPQVILSGLPLTGDHTMHPFIIDSEGHMFVDLGSATNSCQLENRIANSPGHQPCTELETRAGIWLYDANKTGQRFSPTERYATGLRNGEGFAFDSAGRLFVTQHGRDQLSQNWPSLFTSKQNAELPAEEIVQLEKGADYGWPECYYDGLQNRLVLAPEYGGDGKKVGDCANKRAPVASFPGHWAANDLLIYSGNAFPRAYKGGAFVAFHGSSDRAPEPQDGYNVVFQALADGKAAGAYIVFIDGFAGAVKQPGQAAHRPSGLAMGPDGALYISDDWHGRIWRVTYHGDPDATLAPAPSPLGRD